MKRTLFITIGAIALFLIFALWLYLLLFGTPRTVSEVVGDFGFGDVTVTPITPDDTTNDGTGRQLDLSTAGTLYQLTTKPVAGFRIVSEEETERVLYAERGTGHVYAIDVASGEETRISAKTFVAVNQALFARDGNAVVLIQDAADGTKAYLQKLDEGITDDRLPDSASNVAFSQNQEVRYTLTSQNGTAGYAYDLGQGTITQLFNTPLSDVRVIWSAGGPLLYPRTAPRLSGRLYEATSDILTPVGSGGVAFSAMASEDFLGLRVETSAYNNAGNLVSRANLGGTGDVSLGVSALPEKCAFDPSSMMTIWCASPAGLITPEAQSNWYKGVVSFTDSLWRVDLTDNGAATVVDDLSKTSGRQIDVTDIVVGDTGEYLLFKNKSDDTLWLKRLSLPSAPETLDATADEELLGDGEKVTDGEI